MLQVLPSIGLYWQLEKLQQSQQNILLLKPPPLSRFCMMSKPFNYSSDADEEPSD